jgi:hypothetical protein
MNRIMILVASSAALLAVSGAAFADDTFADCDSAASYGWNTASFYVSASMNRAACDVNLTEKAEAALGRALKRQRIAPRNSEAIKVCFYDGLYRGYVAELARAHDSCDRELSLAPSVARAAVAVFTAMHQGLASVDRADVNAVFDDVFEAPAESADACARYVLTSDAGHLTRVDILVDSVCWND